MKSAFWQDKLVLLVMSSLLFCAMMNTYLYIHHQNSISRFLFHYFCQLYLSKIPKEWLINKTLAAKQKSIFNIVCPASRSQQWHMRMIYELSARVCAGADTVNVDNSCRPCQHYLSTVCGTRERFGISIYCICCQRAIWRGRARHSRA